MRTGTAIKSLFSFDTVSATGEQTAMKSLTLSYFIHDRVDWSFTLIPANLPFNIRKVFPVGGKENTAFPEITKE